MQAVLSARASRCRIVPWTTSTHTYCVRAENYSHNKGRLLSLAYGHAYLGVVTLTLTSLSSAQPAVKQYRASEG